MNLFIDIVVTTLTAMGAVGCTVFVVTYWMKTNGIWMKNEVGRYLMLTNGTLGFLFYIILANRFFGEWPGRTFVTIVLFALFVAFSWWPMRLLYRLTTKDKVHD